MTNPERTLEKIFKDAIDRSASDIHFAPLNRQLINIFFRIHGQFSLYAQLGAVPYGDLCGYIKKLAGAARVDRTPTSRNICLEIKNKQRFYRAEIGFSHLYEHNVITLRQLNHETEFYDINRLGFDSEDLISIKASLLKRNGLILVSGPTGSGKTTTLYSFLRFISSYGQAPQNIITIEQPIDRPVPGITQFEPKENLRIADIVKSTMRHTPDIIMIGEIRDSDSAIETVRAAYTGHLVMTTIHANSSLTAVNRMVQMGVEPYNLTTVLSMSMAQRLYPKLCPECREETQIDEVSRYILIKAKAEKEIEKMFKKGKGCPQCTEGIAGQVLVYEMMRIGMDDQHELLDSLKQGIHLDSLRKQLIRKTGTKSINRRILDHIKKGNISIEDAIRQF